MFGEKSNELGFFKEGAGGWRVFIAGICAES